LLDNEKYVNNVDYMKTLIKTELDALHKVRAHKSVEEIARLVDVTRQCIYNLLKADAGVQIEMPTWLKLEPVIKSEIEKYQKSPTAPTDCEHICEKLTPWEKNLLKRYANIVDDEREKVYEGFKRLVNDTEEKHALPDDAQKKSAAEAADVPGAGGGHKHKHFEGLHDKAV
jgi:predicted transcriptional regulator